MAAAQMPRNPLYTPPARPQTQHLRYVVRRLHHLPPWIVPRWGFRDSLLLHSLSPQLAKEGAIPRGAEGAIFHGARQACPIFLHHLMQAFGQNRRRARQDQASAASARGLWARPAAPG